MNPKDTRFIRKAIQASKNCQSEPGKEAPKVGVVVVKDGEILAISFRGQARQESQHGKSEHAEMIVLNNVPKDETIAGATLYTTFEPCFIGRHPDKSCAEYLIDHKISRVVIGMLDPNPETHKKGKDLLLSNDVKVEMFPSDLAAEVEDLNRDFIRHMKTRSSQDKTGEAEKNLGDPITEIHTGVKSQKTEEQKLFNRGNTEQHDSRFNLIEKQIGVLPISEEIRQNIVRVVEDPEYPKMMSIAGTITENRVWNFIDDETRQQIIKKYCLDNLRAPKIKHLDMLLIKCNDKKRHGYLRTYWSREWDTELIPFCPVKKKDKVRRAKQNAEHINTHWDSVTAESIKVNPLPGKYVISLKPNIETGFLTLYIFEFNSVKFTELPVPPEKRTWRDIDDLRSVKKQKRRALNLDVIDALHEWFHVHLHTLPSSSLPDGFDNVGGD